ncbi:hypothetical protein [Streptomyces virginiae]|uniref:hypothetical protein n=1 Tax=Streptomyces virginiae TaxID=1961 RepID=UPI00341B81AC
MYSSDIDDPDVDGDHVHRLLYRRVLFTGEAEECIAGRRVRLTTYREGAKDGSYWQWYASGACRPRA